MRPVLVPGLFFVSLIGLLACGGGKSTDAKPGTGTNSPPADQREPAATSGVESGESVGGQPGAVGGELAENSFQPASRAEAKAAKATIAAKLAEGRKAVKAKRYAEGIAALEEARELGPTNGTILGELGWAHFLAGELDSAERTLKLALEHTRKDATRGAILYNLGRVAESRGDTKLAADLYARSLLARPNDVVEARLDELGGEDTVAHVSCPFVGYGAAPSDLCSSYAQLRSSGEEDWDCQYGETRSLVEGGGAGHAAAAGESAHQTVFELVVSDEPLLAATVFSVEEMELLQTESFVVAVAIGDEWYSSPLVDVSHPGVGYADENVGSIELEARELTGQGKPEIVIRWSVGGHDMDPGIEYMHDYSSESVAVISVDDGTPRWMATVRTRVEVADGAMDPDAWGEMLDPNETKGSVRTTFDGNGSLTVAGDRPPKSTPTGTFELLGYPVRCPAELTYVGY